MKRISFVTVLVGAFLLAFFISCDLFTVEPTGPGTLVITSTPSGAKIILEAYYPDWADTTHITPHTFVGLEPKDYHIHLKKKNYRDWYHTATIKSKKTITVHADLNTICPRDTIGDLSSPPEIKIVEVQLGDDTIKGTAKNIDTGIEYVVLLVETDIWYVQPLIASPYTCVNSDGSWQNWTHPWNRIVALLVDTTYVPGSIRIYHPSSDPGVLAWDEYPYPRPEKIVDFSGYKWKVKNADIVPAGPGPNYFSDSSANVWVDDKGLHLKIDFRDSNWYCAEVFLDHSLGYGEYTFQLSSRVDSLLNYRDVFAGFVYESNSREIDIEFSRALANPNNAQYVVQPYSHPGNILKYSMPGVTFSTHRFIWRVDRIEFMSWRGIEEIPSPDSIIQSWSYTGADIPPPGAERMRFNLWINIGGMYYYFGPGTEVIVKSFKYTL